MPQVGTVRVYVLCAIGAVEVSLFFCLLSSCNDATKVGGQQVCETGSEGRCAKLRGHRGYNPATPRQALTGD